VNWPTSRSRVGPVWFRAWAVRIIGLPGQSVHRYRLRNHIRHSVRPGLTGAEQTEHRGSGKMLHECFDVDIDYVHNITFQNDMRYLVQTIRVLTTGS
jgi:lipopolysaccharide/colanic/teichoic acid biosynthesis glycosyltransferase